MHFRLNLSQLKPSYGEKCSVSKIIDSYQNCFKSDLVLVDNIVKILENFGEKYQFESDFLSSCVIAITEAFNNAIKHGNKEDINKTVDFKIEITGKSLTAIVKDQGTGFKEEDVPDPLAEENLLKNSGRGLYLIRSLMDSVDVKSNDSGTQITMVKTY